MRAVSARLRQHDGGTAWNQSGSHAVNRGAVRQQRRCGAYYAYSNVCLHQGGPACEGLMIENVVDIINPDRTYEGQKFGDEMHFVCPWHGWEYDLKTGEMVGDRKQKLRKYEVVQRGDEIYVVA
jgi:nitrite reductase/ring-hydroxylating ferredoxin subunit